MLAPRRTGGCVLSRSSCHQPPTLEFVGRALDGIDGNLAAQPFCQLLHSREKIDARRKAELGARAADVGEAVADVAGAIFAGDLRRDVGTAHHTREILGDGENGPVLTGSDVENVPADLW